MHQSKFNQPPYHVPTGYVQPTAVLPTAPAVLPTPSVLVSKPEPTVTLIEPVRSPRQMYLLATGINEAAIVVISNPTQYSYLMTAVLDRHKVIDARFVGEVDMTTNSIKDNFTLPQLESVFDAGRANGLF